jgi:hypothetical protein
MRGTLVLIMLGLLLLALTPAAEAREILPPAGDDCVKPTSTGVHKTCGRYWVVNNTMSCIWNGYWYEVDGGAVAYREYRCSGSPPS